MNNHQAPLLLFDGVCNLCVGSVQFFLKHERKPNLMFASLQSEFGKAQKLKHNIPNQVDSLIYIHKQKAYYYSSAAILAAKQMGGIWPVLQVFLILPKFVRDGLYKYIAKHRYRWFGEKEMCWLPTPDLSQRFLK